MKAKTLTTGWLAAIALAGCVVSSIQPFYFEKDMVQDPALIGTWKGVKKVDDGETWQFQKTEGKAYRLTVKEKDGDAENYTAVKFVLKGHAFLDLVPEDDSEPVAVPAHFVFRLQQSDAKLHLVTMRYAWLEELVKKSPKVIDHVWVGRLPGDAADKGRLVLTASTRSLQSFLLRHLNTAEAWDEGADLARVP